MDDYLHGEERFQDGAITANNPTVVALQQARGAGPGAGGGGGGERAASRPAGCWCCEGWGWMAEQ